MFVLINDNLDISLNVSCLINFEQVSLPFLVLHGGEDKVTDKAVSQQLYNDAASSDKSFKLYPGMWHGLLYGELPENIEIVSADTIGWLNQRSEFGNSRLERELKLQDDEILILKHK